MPQKGSGINNSAEVYLHQCMGNKQETTVQQQNYDTVAITEAWWHDLHNCNVPMDGYELFSRDRKGGKSCMLEKVLIV